MLICEDVHLRIGSSSILNGVTFSISRGETVGMIGPNGCGKTTLFNAICGFSPVFRGSIFLNGESISHLPPWKRARTGIGRVFQNSGVFHEMTLLENIVLALEGSLPWYSSFFPWSARTRALIEQAKGYLDDVGLLNLAGQKGATLSGGQKRLLEISRTLAMGASVFLLDEPTAGVSPKMKGSIADMMMSLRKEDKTILVIEHDINFIQGFCDRILVMDGGRVVLDDTPERVRNDPRLQEIYFGGAGGGRPSTTVQPQGPTVSG